MPARRSLTSYRASLHTSLFSFPLPSRLVRRKACSTTRTSNRCALCRRHADCQHGVPFPCDNVTTCSTPSVQTRPFIRAGGPTRNSPGRETGVRESPTCPVRSRGAAALFCQSPIQPLPTTSAPPKLPPHTYKKPKIIPFSRKQSQPPAPQYLALLKLVSFVHLYPNFQNHSCIIPKPPRAGAKALMPGRRSLENWLYSFDKGIPRRWCGRLGAGEPRAVREYRRCCRHSASPAQVGSTLALR